MSKKSEKTSPDRILLWAALFSFFACLFTLGCGPQPVESTSPNSGRTAELSANPNPVPAGEGPGKTTINWQTSDGTVGEIYLVAGGAPETLFARASNGPAEAPWIVTGNTYEFLLYAGTDHKTLLGKVTVTRATN